MALINPKSRSEKDKKAVDLAVGFKRPGFRISKPLKTFDHAAILSDRLGEMSFVMEKKPDCIERILEGGRHCYKALKNVAGTVKKATQYISLSSVPSVLGLGSVPPAYSVIVPAWGPEPTLTAAALDLLSTKFTKSLDTLSNPYHSPHMTVDAAKQRISEFVAKLYTECDAWKNTWTREQLISSVKRKAAFKAKLEQSQKELEAIAGLIRGGRGDWEYERIDDGYLTQVLDTLQSVDRLVSQIMANGCDHANFIRDRVSLPTIAAIEAVERALELGTFHY